MNLNRTYAEDFLGEMSPAGQRVQQRLTPYQQFRVSGSIVPPDQETQYGDPMVAFDELDPADDSFLDKQAIILQSASPDLFRNPSVQSRIRQANAAHAEAQTYFKEDPTLVDFYISQRQNNVAPSVALEELRKRARDNTVKGSFLKGGGLESEYETLRDPVTGTVDRFKAMDLLNQMERRSSAKKATEPKPLTAEMTNRILSAEDDLRRAEDAIPKDEETTRKLKRAAFAKTMGLKGKEAENLVLTDEQWGQAFDFAYPDVRKARERLESLKKSAATQYQMPVEMESSPSQGDQPATSGAPQREPASSFLTRNKAKF